MERWLHARFSNRWTAARIAFLFALLVVEIVSVAHPGDVFVLANLYMAVVLGATALVPDPYVMDKDWEPNATGEETSFYAALPVLKLMTFVAHAVTLAVSVFTVIILVTAEAGTVSQTEATGAMAGSLVVAAGCVYLVHQITAAFVSTALIWLAVNKMKLTPLDAAHGVAYVSSGYATIAVAVFVTVLVCACAKSAATIIIKRIQYPAAAGFGVCFGVSFAAYGWREYANKTKSQWLVWTPLALSVAYTALVCAVQTLYKQKGVVPDRDRRPSFELVSRTE